MSKISQMVKEEKLKAAIIVVLIGHPMIKEKLTTSLVAQTSLL